MKIKQVLGCEITIDISRTVDCLRDAVDREVRKAEREARRAAESEAGKLQGQLLMHVAMDTSMDRVRSDLARGLKLADVRARLGPADGVIAAIPSEALLAAWANGFIDHDIKSIDRFTGSVLSLTSAAVQRR